MARRLTRQQWLDQRADADAALLEELRACCWAWRWAKFPRHGAPPSAERALGCHLPQGASEPWAEGYGREEVRKARPEPTAEEMEAFWRWSPLILTKLDRRDRTVVLLHLGWRMSFRTLARVVGTMSHETARGRFGVALDLLRPSFKANGAPSR